jgi:hypothetical protein
MFVHYVAILALLVSILLPNVPHAQPTHPFIIIQSTIAVSLQLAVRIVLLLICHPWCARIVVLPV